MILNTVHDAIPDQGVIWRKPPFLHPSRQTDTYYPLIFVIKCCDLNLTLQRLVCRPNYLPLLLWGLGLKKSYLSPVDGPLEKIDNLLQICKGIRNSHFHDLTSPVHFFDFAWVYGLNIYVGKLENRCNFPLKKHFP